jgi:hypothetical protein
MGLKDFFGGGKKKEELVEKAKDVIAEDGKLTPQTTAKLQKFAQENEADLADDKTRMRKDIYNKAVGMAKARGKLSDGEAAELAKMQKFLALRDDQVEKTKFDLARLRTVTEIRQGRLPTVPSSNAALRGIPFDPDEIAHYAVQVDVQDRPSASGMPGVQVKWATAYAANSAKAHTLPTEGARDLGDGYLIFTNKRLVLRPAQGKIAAVAYAPEANLFLYGDGIRIERTVGNTILRFKSKSDGGTAEIVGELLAALMR